MQKGAAKTYDQSADQVLDPVIAQIEVLAVACELCEVQSELFLVEWAFRKVGLLKCAGLRSGDLRLQ